MGSSSSTPACVYSDWTPWEPCVNGQTKRTRATGDPSKCTDVIETQSCQTPPETPCCKVCNNTSASFSLSQKEGEGKCYVDYGKIILLTNIIIIAILLLKK